VDGKLLIFLINIRMPSSQPADQEYEMSSNLRMTIVASAITALVALPAWAASDAPKAGSDTSTSSASGKAGSAQLPMGQPESAVSGESGYSGGTPSAEARAPTPPNPLHARTADSLGRMDIVNAAKDKIGSIDSIVTTSSRSEAHAVVSVGGVLGMGARKVLVSLDELVPVSGNKLQINATEDELKARPKYDKKNHVELEGDRLISDSIPQVSAYKPARVVSPQSTGEAGMQRESYRFQSAQSRPAPATPNR
jgi:hypothetical protein